jgi:MFS family permease
VTSPPSPDEFRTPRPIAGWRVVATAFCLATYAWGLGFYSLSLYVHHLGGPQGWSSTLLSTLTTAYFLAGAVAIGGMQRAAARFGRRRVAIAGALLLAAGVAALPRATQVAGLAAAYLVMALGWAATSGTAVSHVIGLWFERRRGLALNLALTGASASGFLLVPLLAWAIARFGVADGLAWVAGAAALAMVALLATNLPEPEARPAQTDASVAASEATGATTKRPLADADGRLAGVTLVFAIAWLAQVAFLALQVPLLVPAVGPALATLAVGATTAASLVGRLLLAPLIDRVDHRRATAASCAVQALGMALLIASDTPAAVLAGSVLFGVSVGNLVTLPAMFAQREFAPARYGAVVDRVWTVGQLTFAFAPAGAGALLAVAGGRDAVLAACLGLQLAAALLCVTTRPGPTRPDR